LRLLRKSIVIGVASVAMLLATATGAHAGVDATSGDNDSAWMKFVHNGDYFIVCDTSGDLLEVYGKYRYVRIDGSEQTGEHRVATGVGTCYPFDHDFGEGRTVTFTACVDNPFLIPDSCHTWGVGRA
jgi:hypothetical protein